MDKHYRSIGLVRDSLLSRSNINGHTAAMRNPPGGKDLNLNMDRIASYADRPPPEPYGPPLQVHKPVEPAKQPLPGPNTAQNLGEILQQASAQVNAAESPAPAQELAKPLESQVILPVRSTLPLYTLLIILALFNAAFFSWVVVKLTELSTAWPTTGEQQEASAVSLATDDSMGKLQATVAGLQAQLGEMQQEVGSVAGQALDHVRPVSKMEDASVVDEIQPAISARPVANALAIDAPIESVLVQELESATVKKEKKVSELLENETTVPPAETIVLAANPPVQAKAKPVITDSAKPVTKAIWLINLGIYGSEEAANKMRDSVQGLGYAAHIVPTLGGENAIYKVQLGNFGSRSAAQNIVDQLENKTGITGLWVSRLN
jgi:cell division septation protein DedD